MDNREKAVQMADEMKDHLQNGIIPFWKKLRDDEFGGIYWSLKYDGTPEDTTKHTYNQAFCIYALASYYEASGDSEALDLAFQLFHLIEDKCTDDLGYMEAFTRDFKPESNEKLSENGVLADKTMNTLLHVFEAYTELLRVTGNEEVKERLMWIMDTVADKVYNPVLKRQEVFFDREYHSIIDLYSYGHDIETAWLLDRGVSVLGSSEYRDKMHAITKVLTRQIYDIAFDGHSLSNECDKGKVDTNRVWWVQAETVVGFVNGWQQDPEHEEYLEGALLVWKFIKEHVIDKRAGSEWFWIVTQEELLNRKNVKSDFYKGVYDRYEYPVLTREHIPLTWRYDLNKETNPYFMERLGINAVMNSGEIELNGKYYLVARIEGNDRKSFFGVAAAGIVRTKDLKHWERLDNLVTLNSPQQRNVVLHPEFVNGKYAFYTRPMDDFIETGSGGGIGFGLCDDITHAVIDEEKMTSLRKYHTITEAKNGAGATPIKTDKGWIHIAHGVRNTAAGLRYVIYAFATALDDPSKVIAEPSGLLIGPRGEERIVECVAQRCGLIEKNLELLK